MPNPTNIQDLITGSGPFSRLKNSTTWLLTTIVVIVDVGILFGWYDVANNPTNLGVVLGLHVFGSAYLIKEGMIRSAQASVRPDLVASDVPESP